MMEEKIFGAPDPPPLVLPSSKSPLNNNAVPTTELPMPSAPSIVPAAIPSMRVPISDIRREVYASFDFFDHGNRHIRHIHPSFHDTNSDKLNKRK
jgi:hypothetical protein